MMSVIVEDGSDGKLYLCSKGAPERLTARCTNTPKDFQSKLTELTLMGFRVLSLAFRPVEKLGLEREEYETDM